MGAYREHALQIVVCAYLSRALPPDSTFTSIDAATDQKMTPIAGARRRARGIRAGWPDCQILYRGQFFGIELKEGAGRQSENQALMQAEIKRAGGRYAICRSVEDVEAALRAWGVPLRATAMTSRERDARLKARLDAPRKAPVWVPPPKLDPQETWEDWVARQDARLKSP